MVASSDNWKIKNFQALFLMRIIDTYNKISHTALGKAMHLLILQFLITKNKSKTLQSKGISADNLCHHPKNTPLIQAMKTEAARPS